MADANAPFTSWLKRRRRALDLTQQELACQVGCALTTLTKIESGERRPSKQIAERLAAALGIPPGERPAFIAYARAALPDEIEASPGAPPGSAAAAPWREGAAHARRHNLPRQLTSFVGREREMAEVRQVLTGTCLLTLTGAGGSGKTRLALAVAEGLGDDYRDGVWWVDLARLAEPELLAQAVAAALSLRPEAAAPLPEQLADYLQRRQLLLLLDNCEHLIAACAGFADAFLRTAPGLTIFATSREPLGIEGEKLYVVPTLQVPEEGCRQPLGELARVESVRLFGDRAAAARPGFAIDEGNVGPVAEICRRLDGMPLAIELAAARVKELSMEELCRRLDDRFQVLTGGSRAALPRRRTLRATLDWSHGLLTEGERVLLRRLAVFNGGWDLEAAEAVCGGGDLRGEVMDALSGLVDKSLVILGWRGQAGRYGMLETMRQYAFERLVESGEEGMARQAHAGYFLALAESAEPHLYGPEQSAWLARLDDEHNNLRGAYACLREGADPLPGLRLAAALWRFWEVRGYLDEAQTWLSEMLGRAGPNAEPHVRAKALLEAGACAFYRHDPAALAMLIESRELLRSLGDRQGIARALYYTGWLVTQQGKFEEAMRLVEESAALFREIGDRQGLCWAIGRLGLTAWNAGHPVAARLCLEEGLALASDLQDKLAMAWWLALLSLSLWESGDYARSRPLAEEGVALCRELGDRRDLGLALLALGVTIHDGEGDEAHALECFREALAIYRNMDEKFLTTCALGCVGAVYAHQSRAAEALRLGGVAKALCETVGMVLPPAVDIWIGNAMTLARQALPPEAAEAAWAHGRALSPEQAISEAMGEAPGKP